jgi:hypothetical protein
MEPTMWWRCSARTNFLDRNWEPRWEWTTHPATSPRRATAFSKSMTAIRDFVRESME